MSTTVYRTYPLAIPYDWLYHPSDCEAAHAEWKASCGPAAYAAVARIELAQVRPLFPHFPQKDWPNVTHLSAALAQQYGPSWSRYITNYVC